MCNNIDSNLNKYMHLNSVYLCCWMWLPLLWNEIRMTVDLVFLNQSSLNEKLNTSCLHVLGVVSTVYCLKFVVHTRYNNSTDLNNSENLRKLVRRLPMYIHTRWVERVDSSIESGVELLFSHLTTFVQHRVHVANSVNGKDLVESNQTKFKGKSSPKQTSNTLARCTFETQSQSSSNPLWTT